MLSLVVPTYSSHNPQIMANLNYLAAFPGDSFELVISDCSGDPAKQEHLQRLVASNPKVRTILSAEKIPLFLDLSRIIRSELGSSDYVAFCADDDYLALNYLRHSRAVLQASPDVVCSYGNFIVCQSRASVFSQSRSVLAESAVERIAAGLDPNSFNTSWFAVFRRQALLPWAAFCADHPLLGPFFDFIHHLSLLAQGKIRTHDIGQYLWTAENWDTPEKNWQSRLRYYRSVGVPDSFAYFHDLHFAMECANFLLGRNSPVRHPDEKLACAQVAWDVCMARFRRDLGNNEQLFGELLKGRGAAMESLRELSGIPGLGSAPRIEWFAQILEVFSVERAERYRDFDFGLSGI